jgi:hypothetical protein
VSENKYLSELITESAYILGTRCKYYEIITGDEGSTIIDVECDPIREYKDPVIIDVIFSDHQLKRRGSVSTAESDHTQQSIYIPKYDIDGNELSIYKHSMIEVLQDPYGTSDPQIIGNNPKYDISSVLTSSHQTTYWECKITPHRDQIDVDDKVEGVQSTISDARIMMDSQYIKYNPKDVGSGKL